MIRQIPAVEPFDPQTASPEQLAALTELVNGYIKEVSPDDPPNSVEGFTKRLQNIPAVFSVTFWAAWSDSRAAAFAEVGFELTETNQHVAHMDITVAPDYRRLGLGSSFLPSIVEVAKGRNRRLLFANTASTVPTGERFLGALGGSRGLALRRNVLDMSHLDRQLISSWIERAGERASGFSIVELIGPYPDDVLPRMSEIQLAINAAPTEDLDIQDYEFSPEHLRQFDEAMVAQGKDRWALVAVENETGRYAGWTELYFNPDLPGLADVGGTAVMEEYKNLGLGRWLKAAIMEKLARERPDIHRVRTGNAGTNAPMLKINDELGFRPDLTYHIWQVEIAKVEAYLSARNG